MDETISVDIVKVNKKHLIPLIKKEIDNINDNDFVEFNITFKKFSDTNDFRKHIIIDITKYDNSDMKILDDEDEE